MKKKITKIFSIIILSLIIVLIGNQIYKKRKYIEYGKLMKNFSLVKENMKETEVIKIMGKPTKVYWLKEEDQHGFSLKRIKKALVYRYCIKVFYINDCHIVNEIWFDEKGERVVNLHIPLY